MSRVPAAIRPGDGRWWLAPRCACSRAAGETYSQLDPAEVVQGRDLFKANADGVAFRRYIVDGREEDPAEHEPLRIGRTEDARELLSDSLLSISPGRINPWRTSRAWLRPSWHSLPVRWRGYGTC